MIDRGKFFLSVRHIPFPGHLTESQVNGLTAILDEWDTGKWQDDKRKLAYMFATAFHETAQTMQPIEERGQSSYFNKYEPGTRIGDMLGNMKHGDGLKYKGRGLVQLTGLANYRLAGDRIGVDLVNHPELACVEQNAVRIMFHGMFEGWFTGRKLGDYFTNVITDYVKARKIINGLDCAEKIAGYAAKFYAAL